MTRPAQDRTYPTQETAHALSLVGSLSLTSGFHLAAAHRSKLRARARYTRSRASRHLSLAYSCNHTSLGAFVASKKRNRLPMYSQLHWADLVLNRVICRLQRRVTCLLQISAPQFVLLFLVLLRFSLFLLFPLPSPFSFSCVAWTRELLRLALAAIFFFCFLQSVFLRCSIFLLINRNKE